MIYIFFYLANIVENNPSPVRQVASLPTYEEILDQNETNIIGSDNTDILENELKTEPPTYDEALWM